MHTESYFFFNVVDYDGNSLRRGIQNKLFNRQGIDNGFEILGGPIDYSYYSQRGMRSRSRLVPVYLRRLLLRYPFAAGHCLLAQSMQGRKCHIDLVARWESI
jgi:hypothetical protein